MPSPSNDDLAALLIERESLLEKHRERQRERNENLMRMSDPSPECQGAYDTAVAADATYAAAVAATNNAMANEQTVDLLRQAAWEAYWNCESP